MGNKPPAWLVDYIALCQERLRLQHWNIHILLTDVPNPHEERSVASTSTVSGSVSAWMRFRDDIAPDRDGYCTATHEVLHLAFAAMDWAMDYRFNQQPKKLRQELWRAYTPGYETGIDHLAEALAALWMPPGDNNAVASIEEPAINAPPAVG